MLRDRLMRKLSLPVVLAVVIVGLSACYKDAGENVQPTSNRVNLSDIQPTQPVPPTAILSPTPPVPPAASATRTLIPTTTPYDMVQPTAGGESEGAAAPETAPSGPVTDAVQAPAPTNQPPQIAPSFTPVNTVNPTPQVVISTPGMNDIMPSSTPAPTIDPVLQPTPTAIPVEENPCFHVVSPNDTLYSIAQDNGVILADLVAVNAVYLGGNPNTPLQIGWELKLPGCGDVGTTTELAAGSELAATETAGTGTGDEGDLAQINPAPGASSGQKTTHVIQSGETIYSIARRYGVDPQAIIDANGLANPNFIQPGQTLIIPAAQ